MSAIKEIDFTAIRDDSKALNQAVSLVISTGKTYRSRLKVVALATCWHACKYGQTAPMLRLFNSLVSNDQVAFRSFLRRLHIYVGGVLSGAKDPFGLRDENGKPLLKESINILADFGSIFTYAQKDFHVVSVKKDPRATEKRQCAMELLTDKFLPAGDKDAAFAPFFVKNNFAEIRKIGDVEVLEKLKAIARDIGLTDKTPNPDRVQITASEQMKTFFTDVFAQAEALVERTSESETEEYNREEAIEESKNPSRRAAKNPPTITQIVN